MIFVIRSLFKYLSSVVCFDSMLVFRERKRDLRAYDDWVFDLGSSFLIWVLCLYDRHGSVNLNPPFVNMYYCFTKIFCLCWMALHCVVCEVAL